MTDARDGSRSLDYRRWQRGRIVVGSRAYGVATKSGLAAHGHDDPGTLMLAEAVVAALGREATAGGVVVSMPSGNGLVGAVAATHGAAAVWMTDRNGIGAEASRRTLEQMEITTGVDVRLGHGAGPLPADLVADIVAIRVVPERLPMQQLLHDARRLLRPGGICLVAGANAEGAKTAARALQQMFGSAHVIAQHSSHRLVSAIRPESLPPLPPELESEYLEPHRFHEIPVAVQGFQFTLFTRPGVFSWEHLDEASAVLSELLDVSLGERVLDIGCGAGALGTLAAWQSRTGEVVMVDADVESVRCANRTLQAAGLSNASAVVSDIASAVLDQRFDVVVANPPFHVGKHTDLEVPRQFIRDAFEVLRPGGRLRIVANRTLPYEGVVQDAFGQVQTLHDGRRFKVLGAVKP